MNMFVAPSFLDVEAAYRREQIKRDWRRAGSARHRPPRAPRPERGGSGRIVLGRGTVAAAR